MSPDMVKAYKIGDVLEYDARFRVALVRLNLRLKVGDTIQLSGILTDFRQRVESMKKGGESIRRARAGDEVHIEMEKHVRAGDAVVIVPG